ncbi:hypothetical protein D4R52_02460 [bacterium]|nr:MAG: hypothetical protein D4R52_02460 [bacterium]
MSAKNYVLDDKATLFIKGLVATAAILISGMLLLFVPESEGVLFLALTFMSGGMVLLLSILPWGRIDQAVDKVLLIVPGTSAVAVIMAIAGLIYWFSHHGLNLWICGVVVVVGIGLDLVLHFHQIVRELYWLAVKWQNKIRLFCRRSKIYPTH